MRLVPGPGLFADSVPSHEQYDKHNDSDENNRSESHKHDDSFGCCAGRAARRRSRLRRGQGARRGARRGAWQVSGRIAAAIPARPREAQAITVITGPTGHVCGSRSCWEIAVGNNSPGFTPSSGSSVLPAPFRAPKRILGPSAPRAYRGRSCRGPGQHCLHYALSCLMGNPRPIISDSLRRCPKINCGAGPVQRRLVHRGPVEAHADSHAASRRRSSTRRHSR